MVAWVVTVSLIPLLVCAVVLGRQFQTAYRAKILAQMEERVLKHKQDIDFFLRDCAAELRMLAALAPFTALRDEASLVKLLATMREGRGGVFEDLGLLDSAGNMRAYAGPFHLKDANYAEAGWFQAAEGQELSISDVFLGRRGLPHFVVSVRYDVAGRQYLLRSTIDFASFTTLVQHIGQGSSAQACIINSAGEFQTPPKKGLQLDIPFLRGKIWGGPAGQSGLAAGEVAVFTQPNPISGQKALTLATTLKEGQWALIYQQDEADAFPDLDRIRLLALAIVLLGGLGILAAALVLTRRMVGRITAADAGRDALNEQVIEAGKMAAVGELAADIAHEINNPVAIMTEEAGWILDILAGDDQTSPANLAEMRRALNQIRVQGARCRDVTHKLLNFARKGDPLVKAVDLNDLVAEMTELSARRARYAGVRLRTDLAPGLAQVAGLPSELQQILLNLINNALDAMGKNGGDLTITTRPADKRVKLSVADTGHGIPKALQPRIFEPFFTTKAPGTGTGLGLSICAGIVKKLGGEITVVSEPEQGTTFTVLLPAAPLAAKDGADTQGKDASGGREA